MTHTHMHSDTGAQELNCGFLLRRLLHEAPPTVVPVTLLLRKAEESCQQ